MLKTLSIETNWKIFLGGWKWIFFLIGFYVVCGSLLQNIHFTHLSCTKVDKNCRHRNSAVHSALFILWSAENQLKKLRVWFWWIKFLIFDKFALWNGGKRVAFVGTEINETWTGCSFLPSFHILSKQYFAQNNFVALFCAVEWKWSILHSFSGWLGWTSGHAC